MSDPNTSGGSTGVPAGTPTSQPAPAPTADAGEPKTVPVYELVKTRERAQAAEKRLADLEAELKKRDAEKLSKEEQLSSRLKELEPFEVESKVDREWFEKRRDAALSKLPEERQKQLRAELASVHPRVALSLLESTLELSAQKPTEPTAPVERGGPARRVPDGAPKTIREWKALPTAAERQKWLSIVDQLPD